jgi:hypothetical protein
MLMNAGTIQPSKHMELLDMADPKDLQEAADAIHGIRGLPAVQRHKELEEPLRQAEEWARKEYRKIRERNGDRAAGNAGNVRNDPGRVEHWRGDPKEAPCLFPAFPPSCPGRRFRNPVSSARHVAPLLDEIQIPP